MDLYSQGAGCYSASLRAQDHNNADQKKTGAANGGTDGRLFSRFSAEASTSSRTGPKSHYRGKRSGRTALRSGPRIGVVALLVFCIVGITIFGGDYFFSVIRNHAGSWKNYREDDSQGEQRSLHFGKSHVQNEELLDRDSRYWDRDDRIRAHDLVRDSKGQENQREAGPERRHGKSSDSSSYFKNGDFHHSVLDMDADSKRIVAERRTVSGNGGLYNEGGRKELRIYEEQLEAASKQELDISKGNGGSGLYPDHRQSNADSDMPMIRQTNVGVSADTTLSNQTLVDQKEDQLWEYGEEDYIDTVQFVKEEAHQIDAEHDYNSGFTEENVSAELRAKSKTLSGVENFVATQQLARKTKHHRRSGSPCEIDFLDTTDGLKEPDTSLPFANFTLKYVEMEYAPGNVGWEPRFAGHQSLAQRNQSFKAEDQTVHCGFVQAAGYSKTTGFDLSEDDWQYLRTCRIAVSSCIFGSSDNVRSPRNRKLTGSFKKDVCFVMFVDQSTLDMMQEEGQQIDEKGYLGPWKIVLVKHMPYMDARRVGKIPKFLTHRLFPAARYSIWLDSKLRLQNDPVLILEYFLWRGGYEYAISNHYDRHCVWEEVQQNKKLNKYNHTAIDEQFAFYRADGLTRFNASDRKKLLPSNVPEGSFIIRAHTPMSNLFSCLWFNEVDRFTSRDQLSFAYTYMKFVRTNSDKHFFFNMFKDCERKTITKLFRHRKNTSSFENHVQQGAIQ